MSFQYSDMRCRTCASNFATKITPRDIKTLIAIILPLKQYRRQVCYRQSWHIDKNFTTHTPCTILDAILNIFIYELAKSITNESYEIVETKQVKIEQTLVWNYRTQPTRTRSIDIGSIVRWNSRQYRRLIASVAKTNTADIPEIELATATTETIASQSETAPVANTLALSSDPTPNDASDLFQPGQNGNTALAQFETSSAPPATNISVESKDNADNNNQVQMLSEEQPLVGLVADDQNIENLPTENQISNSPPVIDSNDNASNHERLWIFEQAAEQFTLQIGSYKTPNTSQAAPSELELTLDPLLKHRQSSDDKWQYLLYGSYQTIELAEAAAKTLSLKGPWIRTFESLQKNRCKAVDASSAEPTYCKSWKIWSMPRASKAADQQYP